MAKKNFLERMGHALYNMGTQLIPDTDHPTCPECGASMNFYGGDRALGEGYWECPNCNYTFTEEDVREYVDDNDEW